MSWRYLRSIDRLTNNLNLSNAANMKLFKPNGTNITLFFAASIAVACSIPRIADGSELTTPQPPDGSTGNGSNGASVSGAAAAAATTVTSADSAGTTSSSDVESDKSHSSNNPASSSSSSSSSSSGGSGSGSGSGSDGRKCPPYGCPLLPRDMYFDEEAQAALKAIRSLHEKHTTTHTSTGTSATVSPTGSTTLQNSPTTTTTTTATTTTTTTTATAGSGNPQEDNNNNQAPELQNLREALELLKTAGGQDQATLTLIGYKGGNLEDQINQDRAFVVSPFHIQDDSSSSSSSSLVDASTTSTSTSTSTSTTALSSGLTNQDGPRRLLGVFDGHAKLGELVSEYTVQHLPQLLSSKLQPILANTNTNTDTTNYDSNNTTEEEAIQKALIESFIQIDKTAPAQISGGCTASIVLQLHSKIYVANAGDSRSLIATYHKPTSTTNIIYITREDKPDLPEERQRVERMGGQVYIPPLERMRSGASSRVLYVDETTGVTNGLAMSRSIGDWDAGRKGVIPDPTVTVLDIHDVIQQSSYPNAKDDVEIFAVSATDGLLDFVDIQDIAKTIAHSLYVEEGPHPLSACESLITTAATAWWKAKNGRYRDDIALAVSKMSL